MEFYRYNDVRTYYGVKVVLSTFYLSKETPKGYWIKLYKNGWNDNWKWISKTSRKRYAYPTKEEALKNFILRKQRRLEILKSQLEQTETALSRIEIDVKDVEIEEIKYIKQIQLKKNIFRDF